MYAASDLVKDFLRNLRIVEMQSDGLSHGNSLAQPPGGGNCLNWTVGHLVVHRDKAIVECGGEPVMTPQQTERYANESDPVTEDGDDVVDYSDLLSMLADTQDRLAEWLPRADLAEEITAGDRVVPRWKRLHFWYFHDTYHTGQTELLRSLAGFTDRLI